MKLATLNDGTRDGQLIVVARDLKSAQIVNEIAGTLQAALDDWKFIAPQLISVYEKLNQGKGVYSFEFSPALCMAPLPRAYHHVQTCAYQKSAEFMQEMFSTESEQKNF